MEIEWHQAFSVVESYVVKIISQQGSGTGFLIASTDNKELCGIATAAHVIDFAHYWDQPFRIQHSKTGKTLFLNKKDRSIEITTKQDVATIIIRGDPSFPKDSLPIIQEDKRLKVGVEIAWMGYPAIAPSDLCFFSGRVSSWINEGSFYFVDGVAINGVSGGPAFSVTKNSVELIGLVSAYVPNRATGIPLPGLCVVRDVSPVYNAIKKLKDFDEAKKEEKSPTTLPPPPAPPTSSEPTKF